MRLMPLITIFLMLLCQTAVAQHSTHIMTGHSPWPPEGVPTISRIPESMRGLETSIVVSSKNKSVQNYFNYGLAALHSFAYLEAYRSFDKALTLDPSLAMAHWGKAYSLLGVGKTGASLDRLIQLAIKGSEQSNKIEQGYIRALAAYTRNDDDYVSALELLIENYPNELDAKLLLAFFMNDGYDRQGQPKGRQAYGKSILSGLLHTYPNHIGVHHYWIHATEGSRHPERAQVSAKVLEGAKSHFGHIVHMPGHIAWLNGDYQEAVNHFRASEVADVDYMNLTGISAHDYWSYKHNMAYLIVAEIEMGGMSAAKETLNRVKKYYLQSSTEAAKQSWYTFLANYGVRLTRRGGHWQAAAELLETIPSPTLDQDIQLKHSEVLSVLSRENNKTPKAEISNARVALSKLSDLIENNTTTKTSPYYRMLLAEARAVTAAMQGDGSSAINAFNQALEFERNISYEEPPLRARSIAETSGQTFCHFGSYDAGVSIYEDHLKLNTNNGFALLGLIDCMRNKGDDKAMKKYKNLLDRIWLGSSK